MRAWLIMIHFFNHDALPAARLRAGHQHAPGPAFGAGKLIVGALLGPSLINILNLTFINSASLGDTTSEKMRE